MSIYDKFWYDEPGILLKKDNIIQFIPTDSMTFNQRLNAIMRASLIIGIAMYIFSNKSIYLLIPIFGAFGTYLSWSQYKNEIEQFFSTGGKSCTVPTIDNPMMNINLITDPKDKPAACPPNKMIQTEVKKKLDERLFKDVGDIYDNSNNQRQFFTTPSTTIPNEQTQFAKWCFQTGPTCKERSEYCAPPWAMSEGMA